jgi:DHA1 family bicyclomycin/chloramphenicol resistance-like MFS transporter
LTSTVVVVLLTLLMGIQPISTDLYLPALPTVQHELGASLDAAQLTLSTLVICFGLSQLVCGPLADRYGRRPLLLGGMLLYTAASLFGIGAQSIEALIVWRGLQGVAMAAAVTCARSIIRDLYDPFDGARVLSKALTGLGFIAAASPVSGGFIVEWLDWRAALSMLAAFGALTLLVVAWRFEETIPARDRQATRIAVLWRNWSEVLANPTFRAWTLLSAATYGGLFFMLAGSSFVLIGVLGASRSEYGLLLGSMSFAYISGTVLCRRLLRRFGLRRTVAIGAVFSLGGGVMMAALSLAGVHTIWAILLPQYLYAIGHGVHQPCGQAGAVGPFPQKAGTAASLSGFAMTLSALLVGLWLGRHLDGTVYPLTLGVCVSSIAVAAIAWTLVQRDGEPAGRAHTQLARA